jgi:hypothetical protein
VPNQNPGKFLGTDEEKKIAKMLREAERAKLDKQKDRYNLPPVAPGFLRGIAINVRPHEEPCEFGTLQVIEFELSETPKGPGVPVRMAGTYFNHRLSAGTLLDVPDPTPHIRPITPDAVVHSGSGGENELRAYYPGRGETPRRITLMLGVLGIVVPIAFTIGLIVLLYKLHIV